MPLEALGRRVIVHPEKDELMARAEKAGIEIQYESLRSEKARQVVGNLVQIGPRAWFEDGGPEGFGVALGDRVTYSKYGGAFVKDPDTGEEFIVLNDEDIVCKVTPRAQ